MLDDQVVEVEHIKEIIELKFKNSEKALELQAKVYEVILQGLTSKIETLQKIVYIGMGIILALQFILKYVK